MSTKKHSIIWIVDDVPSNRRLLKKILQMEGYICRLFSRAEALLEALKESSPDLILMDVMMPGITGLDALQSMQRMGLRRSVPVILVTSMDDPSTKERAFSWGANEFISKPVRRAELLMRVEHQLRVATQTSNNKELFVWFYGRTNAPKITNSSLKIIASLAPPKEPIHVIVLMLSQQKSSEALRLLQNSETKIPICVLSESISENMITFYQQGATSVLPNTISASILSFHLTLLASFTSNQIEQEQELENPSFIDELQRELLRAKRYNHATSLLVLDFSPIQARAMTVLTIKTILKKLQVLLRSIDRLDHDPPNRIRILLPETDTKGAVAVSRRIRTHLQILEPIDTNFRLRMGAASTRGAIIDPKRFISDAIHAL